MSPSPPVLPSPVRVVSPAPWGSPPTPLLPRWHIETLSTVELPEELCARLYHSASAVSGRSVGDLAGIWQFRSESVGIAALRALSRLASRYPDPPLGHVVMPLGVRSARLLECPFRTRAMNCIAKAIKSERLSPERAVTVGELLSLENLGRSTLLEVMCVAEAALDSGFLTAPRRVGETAPNVLPEASTAEPAKGRDDSDNWGDATSLLKKLLTVTAALHQPRTLADALGCDLGGLMSTLGMTERFDQIPLSDLLPDQTMAERAMQALEEFHRTLSPLEHLVFEHRITARSPLTLEEIGRKASLTRERVRQVEKGMESTLRHAGGSGNDVGWWFRALSAVIHREAGPVISETDLESRISATFPHEVGSAASLAGTASRFLEKDLGYRCEGGICLDEEAWAVVEHIKSAARSIADDVGLIDEHELMGQLPDEGWQAHWESLLRQCDLHRFTSRLALRDTKKARVKAALIEIGRPATREELGELCGVAPSRVGSYLSMTASVVRADKKRWGLAEWVEDEYEGIPAEIIQRIREDGGATRLERLVEELPRLFGVTESSVRAYVKTSRFLLRDSYVSMADDSTIALRPLLDVVHGHTPDGYPFWRFKVEARYFDGYSLAGLPAEFVKALGCEPDGRTWVPVSSPAECGSVSVGWPLASVSGSYVGYLAAPLRELGARPGDHALLVIGAGETVSLCLDVPDREQRGTNSESMAPPDRGRDILQKIKNRQRGL